MPFGVAADAAIDLCESDHWREFTGDCLLESTLVGYRRGQAECGKVFQQDFEHVAIQPETRLETIEKMKRTLTVDCAGDERRLLAVVATEVHVIARNAVSERLLGEMP